MFQRVSKLFSYILLIHTMQTYGDEPAMGSEGNPCIWNGKIGICTPGSACDILITAHLRGQVETKDMQRCGFNTYEELICCPTTNLTNPLLPTSSNGSNKPEIHTPNAIATTQTTAIRTTTNTNTSNTERRAERECRKYMNNSLQWQGKRVLQGTKVQQGEYPFMGAIGYEDIGSTTIRYRCGGTLIHERFLLTAAHCLGRSEVHVLLGTIDLTDDLFSVIRPIMKTHVHPEFKFLRKSYNDIGLIEWKDKVPFSKLIYPICLYTENTDPDELLHISGWGYRRDPSNSNQNATEDNDINDNGYETHELLKGNVVLEDRATCNVSYANTHAAVWNGIVDSQLCAYDPEYRQDTCYGDSGGPLILDVNISFAQYRTVGIVSSGFACGTRTSGIYTRIYSYLDFIEDIVWPM